MTATLLEQSTTTVAAPGGTTLTLVPIDHPSVARAMRRPDDRAALHRTVMALFDVDLATTTQPARATGQVLYRLDAQANRAPRLLVQHRAPLKAGQPGPELVQTDVGRLLDRITVGTTVRFRVVLNAVRTQTRTHTRLPVTDEPDLVGWGTGKLAAVGLGRVHLLDRPATELVHGKSPLWTARYDGTATVTDPDQLRPAVIGGIGRAKAYGCGLLSLALTG